MDRRRITPSVRTTAARGRSALPDEAFVPGIVADFAVLTWTVIVAPAPLSFALAAALAASWCLWLDRHPEDAPDAAR